jgi:phenylacetate-CoA ligase
VTNIALRLAGIVSRAFGDSAVTFGSTRLQRKRRGGVHQEKLAQQRAWHRLPRAELLGIQAERLAELISHAKANSAYYARKYAGVSAYQDLPVLDKSELQEHIDEIVIGDKAKLEKSYTGGTTGKSITVYNHLSSFQERFAILDAWWEMHGYRIGDSRIAWFSGRSLLWKPDTGNGRFWRNNWRYRIRYYSTFHMTVDSMKAYVDDLNRFRPRFFHGFPSAISELARFIQGEKLTLTFRPEAIFTTSETLNDEQRELMERVFGAKVRNHYGASEGAPFILECPRGSLHLDITSGVVEVVDEAGQPAREGEMLVTCFFTRNTPIIRYRIGDCVKLSDRERCACGWDTPLVESIQGRRMDYIEIPGRGKIFNAQIGDCVKDVHSVRKFQVAVLDGRLQVYMVADRAVFEQGDKATFLKKIAERMGDIPVDIHYVPDIPRAASGKHSMVRQSPPRPA